MLFCSRHAAVEDPLIHGGYSISHCVLCELTDEGEGGTRTTENGGGATVCGLLTSPNPVKGKQKLCGPVETSSASVLH